MNKPIDSLKRRIAYTFNNAALLEAALTHRSVGSNNNERLEFLGDSVLNFVIAEALYQRFASASEGDLSRLRASLVKKETLAKIARELQLGDALRLGSGELKSGGYRRDSILADTTEAIIGAVLLDGGFKCCQAFVQHLYEPRLAALRLDQPLKDPKTRLQEYLQARKLPLPKYVVTQVDGADHAQHFRVECSIGGLNNPCVGEGSNRRKAEQQAASEALHLLGEVEMATPQQQ